MRPVLTGRCRPIPPPQRLVGAGRIDLAAGGGEFVGQLAQLFLPGLRIEVRGRQLAELAQQQDQSQEVAENDPLLFLQLFGDDEFVEITTELEQFAGGPHCLRPQIVDAGKIMVEPQPQLVGQAQHINRFFFVEGPRSIALFRRGRSQLFRRHQPQLQQMHIQPDRRQRTGRQLIVPGHVQVIGHRGRHFQDALQGLNPLVAIGDPQLVRQEHAVQRMNAAEEQQFLQLRSGPRQVRSISPVPVFLSRRHPQRRHP